LSRLHFTSNLPVCEDGGGNCSRAGFLSAAAKSTLFLYGGNSMNEYGKLSPEILQELTAVTGQAHVLTAEAELLPYSHDETRGDKYRSMPEAVIRPADAAEVSRIMRLAQKHRLPVTPRGAGTGLSGGAVPLYGGIVLSLERMDRILEIDRDNLVAVVEPGVITNRINQLLSADGLFYPGYPMSKESCSVGGNVATNAGGGHAVKYGVTGRYVLGLEAVLPGGGIIRLGGKRVKDVTGYNLIPLLVGSEGTLAVVTQIILKLLPLPRASMDLLFLFESIEQATVLSSAVMSEGRIIPAALEFMDRYAVSLACKYLGEQLPHQAEALLIVQLDGAAEDELYAQCETLEQLGDKYGALEIYSAGDAMGRRKLWRIREAVPEAVMSLFPVQSGEDMVVPVSEVSSFVTFLHGLAEKYNCEVVSYGHAGDGNIHARFLKTGSQPLPEWENNLPLMLREAYRKAASLGGTISGEHGIGMKRRDYLDEVLGNTELALMRRLKAAFDPFGILNPGKGSGLNF
jgi:glycolate oxidase